MTKHTATPKHRMETPFNSYNLPEVAVGQFVKVKLSNGKTAKAKVVSIGAYNLIDVSLNKKKYFCRQYDHITSCYFQLTLTK